MPVKDWNRSQRFAALHHGDAPLLLPNPWDGGSARVLAHLGFDALATTSSGFAATLGRPDGSVTRDEALAHAALIVTATELPVSADLENGFFDDPSDVAETVRLATETGLAGCSIEDYERPGRSIYDLELAVDRVRAAAESAHADDIGLVLTARAENYIRGNPDLADTINRLQRYQEAGADVVYPTGVTDLAEIRTIVESVDVPVNVIAVPGAPTVAELSGAGVKRVSVGGAFANVAIAALAAAGRELLDHGTYGYITQSAEGGRLLRESFKKG